MNQPNDPNQDVSQETQVRGNPPKVERSRITENVESSVRTARRVRFKRMLVIPVLFVPLFVLLVILGHNLLAKNEYVKNMNKISRQMKQFRDSNKRLPSQEEFLKFAIDSRNVDIANLSYDKSLILEDSPADTVLAYTPKSEFEFLKDGHAVLYLDGSVIWVSPETLQSQLKKRQQFYNSRIIFKDY